MESKLIICKQINSTNSHAEQMILNGKINKNTFIYAEYQVNGRGTAKNSWISEPSKNILCSWVVYPAFLSVSDQFSLSKAVCVAIIDLLSDYSLDARIKWPNDIICENKKIGGVLIEHSIMGNTIRHSIIGIGLNINQENFPAFPVSATSIRLQSGKVYTPLDVFYGLAEKLEYRFLQLASRDVLLIELEYLQKLYRKNVESRFLVGNSEFLAVIRGVNDYGQLLLETENGTKDYGFHEVKMLF